MGISFLNTMTTDSTAIAFEQSDTFVAGLSNTQSTESNFAAWLQAANQKGYLSGIHKEYINMSKSMSVSLSKDITIEHNHH